MIAAEELGHKVSVDILKSTKKDGPDKQGVCTCGWRADFIRYDKRNAAHDGTKHQLRILDGRER